ncbi:replication associated protein [Levilactobacillus zymae]|uniref:replication associated protein n=2 Tax=Levilactobacillus zymae TaxID=267363 RepID=UPI001EE37CF7|nr:replication associated protein [Levilactobacillus zymae]
MMSHRIERTALFHKQFKKVQKDPRWRPIFEGIAPLENNTLSAWDYVLVCFFERRPIPEYFYPHELKISNKLKQQIKKRLGIHQNMTIKILELHFDGHNGDHLLVYHDTPAITTMIAIGTHHTIFDQL